jgi:hypothetical protein
VTLKFCTIAESVTRACVPVERGRRSVVERLECGADLRLRHPQRSLDLLADDLPVLVRPDVCCHALGVERKLHSAPVIGVPAPVQVARRVD